MNHTKYDCEKIRAVAQVAKDFQDGKFPADSDGEIVVQMSREGIRKTHDSAKFGEAKGKFDGHEFWSLAAKKQRRDNEKAGIDKDKQLSHEHVVPVDFIVRKILLENNRGEHLDRYIEQIKRFSLVAIVTSKENLEIDRQYDEHGERQNNFVVERKHLEECGLWARYRRRDFIENIRCGGMNDCDESPNPDDSPFPGGIAP